MQFPEELQRGWSGARRQGRGCLNEVQFPEELQQPALTNGPITRITPQ